MYRSICVGNGHRLQKKKSLYIRLHTNKTKWYDLNI